MSMNSVHTHVTLAHGIYVSITDYGMFTFAFRIHVWKFEESDTSTCVLDWVLSSVKPQLLQLLRFCGILIWTAASLNSWWNTIEETAWPVLGVLFSKETVGMLPVQMIHCNDSSCVCLPKMKEGLFQVPALSGAENSPFHTLNSYVTPYMVWLKTP